MPLNKVNQAKPSLLSYNQFASILIKIALEVNHFLLVPLLFFYKDSFGIK